MRFHGKAQMTAALLWAAMVPLRMPLFAATPGGPEDAASSRAIQRRVTDLDALFDGARNHEARDLTPVSAASSVGFNGGAAPSSYAAAIGAEALKRSMLRDLDFVESLFKSAYAPADWKRRHLGWDLDAEVERARREVLATENITLIEYQQILRRLIFSAKDYHVGVGFASTERASLPFTVQGAGGRYFIVHIDRRKLPKSSFPFEIGDELAAFDGRSPEDTVRALEVAQGRGTPGTDRRLAELLMTSRSGQLAEQVPNGIITIDVRRRGSDRIAMHQLIWDYTPELVRPVGTTVRARSSSQSGEQRAKGEFDWLHGPEMLAPLWDGAAGPGETENPFQIGGRTSFVPDLGVKLWESNPQSRFHAYLYRSPGNGNVIGYVRIPHWSWRNPQEEAEALSEFDALMGRFEAGSDALVIDQVNNPGGSVFYLYRIVSTLAQQAMATPKHRIAVIADTVEDAAGLLRLGLVRSDAEARQALGTDNIGGYPVTYQLARHVYEYGRFIVEQWQASDRGRAGGGLLTPPVHLYGVDHVNPSAGPRYTKPIVLLVNELDFSGGDFFPAIMQDNKRALVFGTRTAGAGGVVSLVEYPNLLGVKGISLTNSIAERPIAGKPPIENLGVTPDVEYALTADDLQGGFQGYRRAVNEAVAGLIGTNGRDRPAPPSPGSARGDRLAPRRPEQQSVPPRARPAAVP